MNTIVGIIVLAAIIWGIVAIIKRLGKKQLASSWSGAVVKKYTVNDYGEDVGEITVGLYKFKVQLSDGKKKDITVPKDLYNSVSVGDKITKAEGEEYPKKA